MGRLREPGAVVGGATWCFFPPPGKTWFALLLIGLSIECRRHAEAARWSTTPTKASSEWHRGILAEFLLLSHAQINFSRLMSHQAAA